jgi:hypothetical protein
MDAVPSRSAARAVQACVFVKMKFLVGVVGIIETVGGLKPCHQRSAILEFQPEDELGAC